MKADFDLPDLVRGCNARTLARFFNTRKREPRYPAPNFQALRERHPHAASARELWKAYVAEQRSAGCHALSYPQFMRRGKTT
jgi:hypothetical protein